MRGPEECEFLSASPRLCRDGQLAIDDRQPSGCCSKNRARTPYVPAWARRAVGEGVKSLSQSQMRESHLSGSMSGCGNGDTVAPPKASPNERG